MNVMTDLNRNYIAGAWVAGSGEIENRNPSDVTEVVGRYAQASAAQLDEALSAARQAQAIWAGYGLERRHDVLIAIGTEMMRRAPELGELRETLVPELQPGDLLITLGAGDISALGPQLLEALTARGDR